MTWEGPNPSKHCDSFAGARSSQMGRFHYWRRLLKQPQIHKGSICDPRYFWRFWRNIWPARTWTGSCVNWMPSRLPGICVLSSLQHYFFVTALSLSLSQHLSTLFAAEVRTSSQDARAARCLEPFGRRKSEQHGKIGQESLLTWKISGMLRFENAQNAACCHLLPSHSAGTFFEVLEPRPWLTIVTTSWR